MHCKCTVGSSVSNFAHVTLSIGCGLHVLLAVYADVVSYMTLQEVHCSTWPICCDKDIIVPTPQLTIALFLLACILQDPSELHPSKGYGFVEFVNHGHALAALRQLNNNPAYTASARSEGVGKGETSRLIVEFSVENHAKLKLQQVCVWVAIKIVLRVSLFSDCCYPAASDNLDPV